MAIFGETHILQRVVGYYSKRPPVVEIRPSQVGRKTENPRVHFCQSAKNDRTGGVLAAESHTFHVVALRLL